MALSQIATWPHAQAASWDTTIYEIKTDLAKKKITLVPIIIGMYTLIYNNLFWNVFAGMRKNFSQNWNPMMKGTNKKFSLIWSWLPIIWTSKESWTLDVKLLPRKSKIFQMQRPSESISTSLMIFQRRKQKKILE